MIEHDRAGSFEDDFEFVEIPICRKEAGLLTWLIGKEPTSQCRSLGFDPWVGKIPWRRAWQPTPVFLPGKSHEQRNLVGYSSWGCKESDTLKQESKSETTVAHQAPLPMGFPRQEYWSRLPFPFPGDLPNPGICQV